MVVLITFIFGNCLSLVGQPNILPSTLKYCHIHFFFQRLINEVPKVENNPSSESSSYKYDYYDYYDPQYDYVEKENYATVVKYNQQRPSLLKRILSRIPILRERQGIVAPFFAPILVGIVVAVASIATASSPEGIFNADNDYLSEMAIFHTVMMENTDTGPKFELLNKNGIQNCS